LKNFKNFYNIQLSDSQRREFQPCQIKRAEENQGVEEITQQAVQKERDAVAIVRKTHSGT